MQTRSSDDTLVIRDATIIDLLRGPLTPRTLVIQGDRIAQIAESPPSELPTGNRVIEGAGRFLIPGLWDMHVHLSNTKASALPMLLAHGPQGGVTASVPDRVGADRVIAGVPGPSWE